MSNDPMHRRGLIPSTDDHVILDQATRLRLHELVTRKGWSWLQTMSGEPKDFKLRNLMHGVHCEPELVAQVTAALSAYDASEDEGAAPEEGRDKSAPTRGADGANVRYLAFDVDHVRAIDIERRSVDFVCSTAVEDRFGECVEQTWKLDAYNRNPIVLYAHQSRDLPIGRAENMRVAAGKDGPQLECTVVFASEKANPKAEQVFQLCRERILKSVSVGFIPRSIRTEVRNGRDVTVLADNELCELSITPVPANPEALAKHLAPAQATRGTAPSKAAQAPHVAALRGELERDIGRSDQLDTLIARGLVFESERDEMAELKATNPSSFATLVSLRADASVLNSIALNFGSSDFARRVQQHAKRTPEERAQRAARASIGAHVVPSIPANADLAQRVLARAKARVNDTTKEH